MILQYLNYLWKYYRFDHCQIVWFVKAMFWLWKKDIVWIKMEKYPTIVSNWLQIRVNVKPSVHLWNHALVMRFTLNITNVIYIFLTTFVLMVTNFKKETWQILLLHRVTWRVYRMDILIHPVATEKLSANTKCFVHQR